MYNHYIDSPTQEKIMTKTEFTLAVAAARNTFLAECAEREGQDMSLNEVTEGPRARFQATKRDLEYRLRVSQENAA